MEQDVKDVFEKRENLLKKFDKEEIIEEDEQILDEIKLNDKFNPFIKNQEDEEVQKLKKEFKELEVINLTQKRKISNLEGQLTKKDNEMIKIKMQFELLKKTIKSLEDVINKLNDF